MAHCSLPVLSPLIAEDKETIVELARTLGTYDISIRPYEDCCSFLVARHPETRVRLDRLTPSESRIPMGELALEALEGAEVYDFPASPHQNYLTQMGFLSTASS